MLGALPYRPNCGAQATWRVAAPGPSPGTVGTTVRVVTCRRARDPLPMTKRVVAAFLWFYTGWYAGAMIAAFIGVSPVLGPILGVAAAGFVIADPRRMFWTRPARAVASSPAV